MSTGSGPKQQIRKTAHATKHIVRHHYYSKMPNKKSHRVAVWVTFLTYSLIVALQLSYPLDRAMPLATIAGENIGWKDDTALAGYIHEKFQATKLELKTGNETVAVQLGATGAEPNTLTMLSKLEEYPLWQRFIPLSIFWQPAHIEVFDLGFTDHVLEKFSIKQAEKLSFKPVNARLAIEQGKLIAEEEKPGSMVDAEKLSNAIRSATITPGKSISVLVPGKKLLPQKSSEDFAEVRSKAERALAQPVVIIAKSEEFVPTEKELASWLVISADKTDRVTLGFDAKRFAVYLDRIDRKVGTLPGTTNVTISNGVEAAREIGKTGSAVTRQPVTQAVKTWLLEGDGSVPITAPFHSVSPRVVYNRTYTASEAGLRAYVTDQSRFMNVHIAVQQVTGKGWSASARASESIPSASTYKLYVAKWLFKQMDQNKINWNDPMLGTTVSGCFDEMTIVSANRCAEAWIAQVGRSNLNNYVYSLGFSHGTSFTTGGATQTTANDLRKFMLGLNDSSLISGAQRDRLLHSLSVHPYRSGIPAGSSGRVWDKVGFLWDYVHDAAIVQHPRGRYVMIVMTKGQSYAKIAEITRQVERLMYP